MMVVLVNNLTMMILWMLMEEEQDHTRRRRIIRGGEEDHKRRRRGVYYVRGSMTIHRPHVYCSQHPLPCCVLCSPTLEHYIPLTCVVCVLAMCLIFPMLLSIECVFVYQCICIVYVFVIVYLHCTASCIPHVACDRMRDKSLLPSNSHSRQLQLLTSYFKNISITRRVKQ